MEEARQEKEQLKRQIEEMKREKQELVQRKKSREEQDAVEGVELFGDLDELLVSEDDEASRRIREDNKAIERQVFGDEFGDALDDLANFDMGVDNLDDLGESEAQEPLHQEEEDHVEDFGDDLEGVGVSEASADDLLELSGEVELSGEDFGDLDLDGDIDKLLDGEMDMTNFLDGVADEIEDLL